MKLLTTISFHVSHELKTPLNIILGSVQIMERKISLIIQLGQNTSENI
ncbi:histidine kinase dimerization/phospho-acceptor domain-containing protein [Serpentinicella alkaliphila]|nr:hypothetical protein HZR23_09560 [Serpentinicella alkaliphila]